MLAAFGARDAEPEALPGDGVWRCGGITLRTVNNPAEAAWLGSTLDGLVIPNLRLARLLRASDGRWVVSGWTASRQLMGRMEPRYDAVIAASLRLHEATSRLERPRFLNERSDLYAVADRLAWAEQVRPLDPERGGDLFGELARLRKPMGLRSQIVHGDLFGNVLFAGAAPPAILNFTPFWRPPEWAAAVIAVDALAWGGADPGLIDRWSLTDWPQALLRALLFRFAVIALDRRSTPESLDGLRRATSLIKPWL